jgi:hypothetical protein
MLRLKVEETTRWENGYSELKNRQKSYEESINLSSNEY